MIIIFGIMLILYVFGGIAFYVAAFDAIHEDDFPRNRRIYYVIVAGPFAWFLEAVWIATKIGESIGREP